MTPGPADASSPPGSGPVYHSPSLPASLLAALECPDDRSPVVVDSLQQVHCPECGRVFSGEPGILRMLPAQPGWSASELSDAAQERSQRDVEAHGYDGLLGLRFLTRWEIPATLGPLRIHGTDRVLEVGCGTGRLTLPAAKDGGELLAVDHSLESLRILRRKLSTTAGSPVLLVQGDATCLPVQTAWATRALSCQMLEHLPSEAMRARAVAELGRCLGAGGRVALSGYWFAPALRWLLPREGKHSGKIFFHRFTRSELRELLEVDFIVEQVSRRLIYILLAHGRRR
jgi:SAM-dependent methyltransferase